ncbi:MAG: PEP-CTERM system histidine kinase PrsK [Candidatus Rokubacteria bacterium]|nr:PEP-CTERM system histidine kinase PrsK [Candidatus Rokubacteria bacterium]
MMAGAPLVAAALSLVFAGISLLRPPRRLRQVTFAGGMVTFALQSLLVYGLLFYSLTPESHQRWMIALQSVALLVPIPWCLFAFLAGRHADARIPRGWRFSLSLGSAGLAVTAAVNVLWPFFLVPNATGPFRYAQLSLLGQGGIAIELLATIAVLYGLEPSLRNSQGSVRWQFKYLALGLGGIFAVRFYLLGQALLFHVLDRQSLLIETSALIIGELFVAIGLLRSGALRTDLTVSRHFVYRSTVVGLCGLYLFLAGAAGWLLNALGIPEAALVGTLVVFVAVMGLAALALSESLRWRFKRYISTHFYADKYDYRQQWRTFTANLTARVTLDGLATQLLRSVTQTIGARKAALYLADETDGALRFHSVLSAGPLPKTLEATPDDFLTGQKAPEARHLTTLGNGRAEALLAAGLVLAVPLRTQGRLVGVLLVGAEQTGAPYTQEDLDLLTTLGEQAASATATVQLSERLAQSRAFEAFNRLSSFIIHDLKNSVSALSMLTQNAPKHFDDPKFRVGALGTLTRTVARMQKLVGRLSTRQPATELEFESLPLDELARDTVASMSMGPVLHLTLALDSVSCVRGDSDAIQRVIQNLITNAVEAMDGEGTITLRVCRQDGMVACAVTDTGCGMTEEFVRTSLFVPFQTTKKGGWGIGLYQAREIMTAHAGRIEVSSQEGRGTTVTLLFPEEKP